MCVCLLLLSHGTPSRGEGAQATFQGGTWAEATYWVMVIPCHRNQQNTGYMNRLSMWRFPKIGVPLNHPF